MSDENVERGAAEENSGTPVTPTEVDASRRPPSQGDDDHEREAEQAGRGE